MKVIKILKDILLRVLSYIVDTIAPPDLTVRAIENMSAEQFIASASDVGGKSSNKSIEQPKPIDDVLHLFPYRTDSGTIRTALVTIKTYHNPRLVKLIAGATYKMLREKLDQYFILIPVPMTRKSLRARGWNQCELICKEIARLDAEYCDGTEKLAPLFDYRPNVLIKVRETADQVGHGRTGRFENLKNSCAVREKNLEMVCGKNILILDDIVTTGSTLSEAKRALLSAGAKSVLCVAVAH